MTEQKNEVAVKETEILPSVTADTDDIIASAERRIANLQKVIGLALKITNQQDWVDMHGKPYLTGSGAQKIARLFGVCWREMKTEKNISDDETGQFYFYKTTGLFYLKGKNDLVEAVGTCSQKDQFFSRAGGKEKLRSEIDETNIMKSSVTNCISNGITSLLGLKNLTWEQVKSGGINQTETASVKFANGGAGGGKISEAQQKRLFAIAKKSGKTNEQIKQYLTDLGIDHTKDISKGDEYEDIVKWAETK